MTYRCLECGNEIRETAHACPPKVVTTTTTGGETIRVLARPSPFDLANHDPSGPCERCGTRSATHWWAPGGALAAVHGDYAAWCEVCCLEEQLAHAEAQAARVPDLRAKLALARGGA